MSRLLIFLIPAFAIAVLGCKSESKPTVFENLDSKHTHDHPHTRDKMMLADIGKYHVGMTAHLLKMEGNELDIIFETMDEKPLPLPLTKVTAKATRTGEEKTYDLEFEPAPKEERKDDPEGKCSRFTAKAPWIKHEDKLTVTVSAMIDGKESRGVFVDFNPKSFAHVDK